MYDVLVVGLGAMGSAALYHLAGRGLEVLGVDADDPPHTLGSTHGRSRIIREAYYEHPSYVPLVRRAYQNWAALEREAGEPLFLKTGGVMLGAPDCGLVAGAMESARLHDIPVELLSDRDVATRFPALEPAPGMVGLVESSAGILFPEACVRAHLSLAASRGAEVRPRTCVVAITPDGDGFRVMTTRGPVSTKRLILAAGPWTSELVAMLGETLPLEVERQTSHWFTPLEEPAIMSPDRLPIMMIEHEPDRIFFTMPDLGDGVKAGIHHEGAIVSPATVDRAVGPRDIEPVERLLRRFLPKAAGVRRESLVCLYTDTPDSHFIIDHLPGQSNVTVLSACSGHGFKFASAIGEAAASMAVGEPPIVDIAIFSAARLH